MERKIDKKTYLIKARPGTFFMEIEKEKIENDLKVNDIIKKYIGLNDVENSSHKTICFFIVEEKNGNKTTAKKFHIGEEYSLEKIKTEFGEDCSLYRNVKNNDYRCAIKYIPGNFGGVDKKDACFTQDEIVKIIKKSNEELQESL